MRWVVDLKNLTPWEKELINALTRQYTLGASDRSAVIMTLIREALNDSPLGHAARQDVSEIRFGRKIDRRIAGLRQAA